MKSILKKEKNNKGFTLVELVIVIAILAILVGLLAPQYTKYVEKSRKAADASNMDEMVKVVKVYAADPANNLKAGAYKITIGDTDTKIEPATANATDIGGTTDVTLVENDLVGLKQEMENSIPSYTSTKTKSKKWGAEGAKDNISATVIVNTQGGTSVTYNPPTFANYMKTGTEETASTNTKPGEGKNQGEDKNKNSNVTQ